MPKLNEKGLKIRKELLTVAIESGDQDFLDCLKNKKNLSTFNALCNMLGGD